MLKTTNRPRNPERKPYTRQTGSLLLVPRYEDVCQFCEDSMNFVMTPEDIVCLTCGMCQSNLRLEVKANVKLTKFDFPTVTRWIEKRNYNSLKHYECFVRKAVFWSSGHEKLFDFLLEDPESVDWTFEGLKKLLRANKMTRHNATIPQLLRKLRGQKQPQPEHSENFIYWHREFYKEIQRIYQQSDVKKRQRRCNALNCKFIARVITYHIEGKEDLLVYFPVLKSATTYKEYQAFYYEVCNRFSWKPRWTIIQDATMSMR